MPHSLRARLSGLRYKKIISDKDYDRLCKALDNEGVLDKIRTEIEEKRDIYRHYNDDDNNIDYGVRSGLSIALKIIDKHIGDTE